jgi:hypothetical protein
MIDGAYTPDIKGAFRQLLGFAANNLTKARLDNKNEPGKQKNTFPCLTIKYTRLS